MSTETPDSKDERNARGLRVGIAIFGVTMGMSIGQIVGDGLLEQVLLSGLLSGTFVAVGFGLAKLFGRKSS